MQDPNGNAVRFNYTGGLLSSLTNNAGQTISFTYNGAGRLASVVDAVASPIRTFTYKYDASGNLQEVKDPLGGTCTYSYLVNGPMKTLSDKNNNTLDLIYFPDFRIREIIGCNKRLSFSFDTTLKKTVVTDYLDGGANQVTTYTYQKKDNLAWITSMSGNCCGFNMRFEYDDQGNNTRLTDANGNVYTYTYDANGNLLSVTDPLGGVSRYTYSPYFNNITSFQDQNNNLYTLEYDNKGNLVKLTAPGNHVYTGIYNAAGDIVSSTDPKGAVFTYNYDAYGNPSTVAGPHGYSARLAFDARGNLLSYTDSRGASHASEYDILDRLKKITDPLNQTWQFGYDAEGNMVSLKNKNNENTTFQYDASNRPLRLTGPTGNITEVGYDAMDNLTSVRDAMGAQTLYGYDTRNRLKNWKDALGNEAINEYDGNGNIISARLPNGRTLSFTYDPKNRLTKLSDGTGDIASYTYDAAGNITRYKNGTGAEVSGQYDAQNRLIRTIDPLGNATSYTYDVANNISSITDRNGFTRHYTYDSLNRVKTFTDNNGFVMALGYDAEGNVTRLTDQNGNLTTYTYDELNRRKRMTFPDGRFEQYAYDVKNNLVSRTLADGTTVSYTYDTLNRLLTKTLPGGEMYSYTYDKMGRVITASNHSGTVQISYDALGRIVAETADGRTVSYSYNTAGRTQTITYPDGSKVEKEFDVRNRISRILKDSVVLAEYAYNNAGHVTGKRLSNGVQTDFQYDIANRLVKLTTAGGTIQQLAFTYDKEGNKRTVNRLNNPALTETFAYDKGYRLISYSRGAQQNTYIYDAVGNRTAANLNGGNNTYTTNNLNQLTSRNGINFTYDARGNLTYDGQFFKKYDAEGRLIKDSASPASVITYAYDVFGRRVVKTINGTPFKYTYSGAAQIEERNALNEVINQTVFTGFLSPVMNVKNGSTFFYHQNEMMSVDAITNNNGRLVESYQYDAFGGLQRYDSLGNLLPSSLAGNRVGFTGQEWDSATNSYRIYYRNYSPATGVFNQRDLIEYGDGTGMYQYVGNNPANGVDVWGLEESFPCANLTEVDKIRIIPRNLIVSEQDKVVKEAYQGFKKVPVLGHMAAGVMADSKFYRDVKTGDGTVGGIDFYFDGQVMKNYDVNYYFTSYANASRGWGAADIDAQITTWNLGKGAADAAWNGSMSPLTQKYNETPLKLEMGQKGYNDYHADTRIENIQMKNIPGEFQYKQTGFGEWWPVFNPKTGEVTYEFFLYKNLIGNEVMLKKVKNYLRKNPCPPPGGTRNPPPGPGRDGPSASILWVLPLDPNDITGPTGVQSKKWVAVKDRMHYTIRCENDTAASSPARFIRITAPVHPKQDPATLELGSFGFNNQTFDVPPGLSSFYQRYDCRDSMGLYLDVVAGYDPQLHLIFWEFRGIDPVTLLPSDDPDKGILFLQDTAHPLYGHGYFNFSIKPESNAVTGDTTAAEAAIVFDENEAIATNVWTNTLDAVAPTSRITEASFNRSLVTLKWTGRDDAGGSGLEYYSLYVSDDGVNYSLLAANTTRTDTSFQLAGAGTYCFFVLATDSVGNAELLDNRTIVCATGGGVVLPVTWLYFNGKNVGKNNLLEWSTAAEQNSKAFLVQRSFDGQRFTTIGTVAAAGNSSSPTRYSYTDRNIDEWNSAVFYYRLQQVDQDGKTTLSNTVRLIYADNNRRPSVVYPNPATGTVTITVGDRALIGTVASLFDQSGRVLQSVTITGQSQTIRLEAYTNGVYYIRLQNQEVLKVIKQ